MPTDVRMTEDRDIEIGPTGDFLLVDGRENIRQQHANAIFRAYEQADVGLLNQDSAENIRVALRDELNNLDYVNTFSIDVVIERPKGFIITVTTDATDNPVIEEVSP